MKQETIHELARPIEEPPECQARELGYPNGAQQEREEIEDERQDQGHVC